MKCHICKKRFKDKELVLPLMMYVVNEKRGSHPTAFAQEHVHLHHLITKE